MERHNLYDIYMCLEYMTQDGSLHKIKKNVIKSQNKGNQMR